MAGWGLARHARAALAVALAPLLVLTAAHVVVLSGDISERTLVEAFNRSGADLMVLLVSPAQQLRVMSQLDAAGFRGKVAAATNRDLIMEIDGRAMNQRDSLTRYLRRKRPGDVIKLKIFRQGKVQEIEITLGSEGNTRL